MTPPSQPSGLDYSITLFKFNHTLLQSMLSDLSDNQLTFKPSPKSNSIRWLISHLLFTFDGVGQLLGHAPVLDPNWRHSFGPSTTDTPAAPTLSKTELLHKLAALREHVLASARNINDELVSQPHGVSFLAGTPLVTRGDLVAHLLTTHFSFHLGQLSTYRRQLGFAPLF